MKMLNNLKMDLYRMVRQKSFYISMGLMLLFYFWLLNAEGIRNDTLFATFDYQKNTIVDFLYYFPKSTFYMIACLVFTSLFVHEEYASGFVKNIYPMQQKKWKLLIERWIFSILVCLIFWMSVVVLAAITNLWHQDSFVNFSYLGYLGYAMMEILLLSAVSAFMMMLNHITKSKVLTVLCSVCFGGMVIFMLHMGLSLMLPENMQYHEATLYYISGNLPYEWEWEAYGKALLVAISSTILYNGISYFVLKKKDIA